MGPMIDAPRATSPVLEEFGWRGLVKDVADVALFARLTSAPVTGYIGFDPSAPGLHLGNLMQILGLARLQRLGHRPIALVGGATGLVGDPSFKALERDLKTIDEVRGNVEAIRGELARFLEFGDRPGEAILVDNYDWHAQIGLLDWLRDVGKHVSISVMLARESISSRLGEGGPGLSYAEFTYQLIQAYDFLALAERYDCRIQLGGSDQWGNIIAGVDLIRRKRPELEVSVLTTPLITTPSGEKFGKSEGNALWLDPERTSPYTLYQFLFNTEDSVVADYLRQMTFLGREEIEAIVAEQAADPGRRPAQRALAETLTRYVHGDEGLREATAVTEALFGHGDVRELSVVALRRLAGSLAGGTIDRGHLGAISAADLLVAGGVAGSRSEAVRLVRGGGASLNGTRIEDPAATIGAEDALHGSTFLVRKGKRGYGLVRVVG